MPTREPAEQNAPFIRRASGMLWWWALGIIGLSGALMVLALVHLRTQAVDDGLRLTRSLGQVIEEQTSRTLQTVDLQLQLAISGLQQLKADGKLTEQLARASLREQLGSLPFLRAIWVLDASGRIVYDTDMGNIGVNLSDRAYFQIYQQQPQTGFYLGTPVRSRTTGTWLVSAARPVPNLAGTGVNVIVAAVEPPYFQRLWSTVNLGDGASVALFGRDGTMMMRSPTDDKSMGKTFPGAPVFSRYLSASPNGTFEDVSPIDGQERLYAYRTLSSQPELLVIVGQARAEVLKPWGQLATVAVAVWGAAAVCILLLTTFLQRSWNENVRAEQRVNQIARRFSLAIDAALIGVWDWDASHAEQWYASPTYFSMLGYDPNEGFGDRQRWLERLHPDDRPTVTQTINGVLAGHDIPYHYETRMLHGNGTYRWVVVTGQVLQRDAMGKPTRMMGVRIDVTERRQAEEKAQKSAQRLRALIDGLGPSIFVGLLNPDGTFVEVNRPALEAANQRYEDVLGKPFEETYWFSYSPESMKKVRDSITLGAQGIPSRFDMEVRVGEGHFITLDCSMQPLLGEDGNVEFLIPSGTEITERKRAEAELQQHRQHLEELVAERTRELEAAVRFNKNITDAVPGIMVYWDVNLRCRFANRGYLEWFGRDHDKVLNHTAEEIFGDKYLASIRAPMDMALQGTETQIDRVTVRDDASQFVHQVHYIPDRASNGDIHGIYVLAFDITAIKNAEGRLQTANEKLTLALGTLEQAKDHLVQSEKLAALGALVAGVAHELNTPIGNSVTMASSLEHLVEKFRESLDRGLRRSELDAFVGDTHLAAEVLLRNLERAAGLVSSFKQVAVDRTSSQRRQFLLDTLASEILLSMSPAVRKSGCKLESSVDSNLRFDSYPGPLGQVLTNLIDNAIVHAFAGDAPGLISIKAQALESGVVSIEVSDAGQGIPSELQKRVFDPFFTTRLGQGGSGLGLHIAHNIVTGVLGGSISLHSEPGAGSTFTVTIPIQAPAQQEIE